MTANVLRILGMIATPVSQRIGVAALRISIAIVFLWIGALKFVPYEADSITPFVANSPVMSFFYKHPTDYKAHLTREGELNPADRAWQAANDTYAFSNGLGTVEVAIGLLTLVGLVSRRWGLLGATLAFLTPFVTLSFLVTTPDAWVPALGDAQHGFPYLSGAGRLVLKDVLLMAGAWLVMADSARAFLATWVSSAPSRGRTDWSLQGAAMPVNAEGRRHDQALQGHH
jgi:reactive chlorine resistance protein C